LGAVRTCRGHTKGCGERQFPKSVGKPRRWTELEAHQAAELKEEQDAAARQVVEVEWFRAVQLEMIKPLALPRSSLIHREPLSPGQEWETEYALAAESTEAIPNPTVSVTRGRSGQFRFRFFFRG
jgi:hypothetical protein